MSIETALIHQARIVRRTRSPTRSAYGEFAEAESELPLFAARLMVKGDVQKKTPEPGSTPGQGDVAERVVAEYEFLAGPEDEEGNPVTILTTDRIRFTEGGPLGNLLLDVQGKPEMLNDGEEALGWRGYASLVQDA